MARGKGASLGADNVLFFPLFRHITTSDIAMTTPVVSTYSPELVKEPKATGEMSMEFVYRSPTMGQTGQGVGAVKVEDHPAGSFVCLGVQGDLDADRMRQGRRGPPRPGSRTTRASGSRTVPRAGSAITAR